MLAAFTPALILSLFVLLICSQKGASVKRHLRIVRSLSEKPLGDTAYAQIAIQYFKGLDSESPWDWRFQTPLWFLILLIFLSVMFTSIAFDKPGWYSTPNLFLSANIVSPAQTERVVTSKDGLNIQVAAEAISRGNARSTDKPLSESSSENTSAADTPPDENSTANTPAEDKSAAAPSEAKSTSDPTGSETLAEYQLMTIMVIGMAVLGAYIMIVVRLLRRINTSDIDPLTLCFFAYSLVLAIVVATVVRHASNLLGFDSSRELMAVVGFVVGLQPDVFLANLVRLARDRLKFKDNTQPKPVQDTIPGDLSLIMLDGMRKEVRLRFEEMGMENAQSLAECNPFVLWARTSFQLQHIIDWIAQAQLFVVVRAEGMKSLRAIGIRDIFAFRIAAENPQGVTSLATTLDYPEPILKSLVASLDKDTSCSRLNEVRDVLLREITNKETPAKDADTEQR